MKTSLTFLLAPLLLTLAKAADAPHFFALPGKVPPDATLFSSGKTIAQRIPGTFTLVSMSEAVGGWMPLDAPAEAAILCEETEDAIFLKREDQIILRYNKSIQTGPEGTDPVYERSGYIHPVYNSKGQEITGDFAPDHPHQHGVFFAWKSTNFEGRKIDFWNQKAQQGRISHQKVLSTTSGPVFGQFQVELLHEDITDPQNPKPVLTEVWTVRAYATSGDAFLFDIDSTQKCASESPLNIEEVHYGGMAIRGNGNWIDEETVSPMVKEWTQALRKDPDASPPIIPNLPRNYLTNDGKEWHDGNHSHAKWVSMYGGIEGEPSSVAILCHPDNFRFPQAVRLHPSKPYFCYAPMVDGAFQIQPGEPFSYRYRFLVQTGNPNPESIEASWSAYAE